MGAHRSQAQYRYRDTLSPRERRFTVAVLVLYLAAAAGVVLTVLPAILWEAR